jgi:ATP-binding cassette subfamily C (CFTR/MRP) protein 1
LQSLARAVYSRAATLILDDVFSGLDNRSIAAISSRLLAADGHFKEFGSTVIFVTHNNRLLPFADEIVLLENGRISRTSTYNEIQSNLPEEKHNNVDEGSPEDGISVIQKTGTANFMTKIISVTEQDSINANDTRRKGKWSVYAYYFESSGRMLIFSLAVAMIVTSFVDKFSSIIHSHKTLLPLTNTSTAVWLQQWSDYNTTHPNGRLGLYIGVYAVLFTATVFCLIYSCW